MNLWLPERCDPRCGKDALVMSAQARQANKTVGKLDLGHLPPC